MNRRSLVSPAVVLMLAAGQSAHAQAARGVSPPPHTRSDSAIFAQERENFHLVVSSAVRQTVVSAARAMPADKYGFAPAGGEFKNVRTFSHQISHLAATNFILAAAALGQDPPADAGDEQGPDSLVTKQQYVAYLEHSFDALARAVDAIGDTRIPVRSSPISPFQGNSASRISLIAEALIHAYDHYGQMVVYLRMNGIVPPASRR